MKTSCLLSVLSVIAIGGCGGENGAAPSSTPPVDDAGVSADALPDADQDQDASPDAPDGGNQTTTSYLIVAADSLAESAKRYQDYRSSTGHTVALEMVSDIVLGTDDSELAVERIRDRVREHHEQQATGSASFVLLLGDADETWGGNVDTVPTGSYLNAAGEVVTSDNVYADVDGDDIPDVAVGRIPVRTDQDVDRILDKVEHYETTYEVGLWNRRINTFASTGGFGSLIDGIIEDLAFRLVEAVAYDFDLTMTYAKQDSPYVYIPEQFSDKVYDRINEGALLVSYVGHGSSSGFDLLSWNGSYFPILDTTQLDKLDVEHKLPILSLVACSTGSFDTGESISEQIIKAPRAPVAILSSTEESHPLANAEFIHEFGQVITVEHPATLGEAFVRAKDRLVTNTDAIREEIDGLSGYLMTPDEKEGMAQSHLHMYTLFGDPAMQIAYPGFLDSITVTPSEVAPGATLQVSTPLGLGTGQATVTLETARSVIPGELQPVPDDGDPQRDAVLAQNYKTANDRVVALQTESHEGDLSATLTVPEGLAPGEYYLKVYAEDGSRDATGFTTVTVSP